LGAAQVRLLLGGGKEKGKGGEEGRRNFDPERTLGTGGKGRGPGASRPIAKGESQRGREERRKCSGVAVIEKGGKH